MRESGDPKNADFPPVIPVGLDAYRMWDAWPRQRIGARAYMRSTYDRTGHNLTADASHYLYQESETFNVTLDVEGPGVLYFVRTNHWHGSPWHYEIDGADHIVRESTTENPLQKLDHSVFLPERAFPSPLTYTYATTKGADLNWVPMAFKERLRLAYARTFYGTGYYIYHQFVRGAALSGELVPWRPSDQPDERVLALLSNAGEDQTNDDAGLERNNGRCSLVGRVVVAELTGPASLRTLAFSVPVHDAVAFGRCRIRVTWDDRAFASIDAPAALFFGSGTLHNSDGREWLVKALPMSVRSRAGRVWCECRFPMPFFRAAKIELLATVESGALEDLEWSLAWERYSGPWNHVAYFHATHVDHGSPRLGHDLLFLDTHGAEGANDWSGSFVGTSLVFTDRNVLTTLEGDPRFFFDGAETPQAQGTGTEEWGGGGDYWGGRTMTLPLAGHPVGVVDARTARSPEELIHSAYRFLLADLMPFGNRAVIRFEHGGENESVERYRSVTYWYGLPSPSLVLTDTLTIGDPASEAAHAYSSPDASAAYLIESRYEWGPDWVPRALGGPLAEPRDCVDFQFDAPAGDYDLWIELETSSGAFDAAVWPQLNSDVGTASLDLGYMGSVGYLNAGAAPARYRFQTALPARVRLATTGSQRLRIQPRLGCARIGRVLLSRSRVKRPTRELVVDEGEVLLSPEHVTALRGAFVIEADPDAPGGVAITLRNPPEEIEIYPTQRKLARRTEGASELTVEITPDNHGVLLRRTLDYAYAHQRARVSVASAGGWRDAGTWYLAGSNTVYHSFPFAEGELGPVRPRVITSNRRFRDDEFLLPVALTRGQRQIRLRFEFAPRNPPLLVGSAPAATAWTEIEYRAYCFVMPKVE